MQDEYKCDIESCSPDQVVNYINILMKMSVKLAEWKWVSEVCWVDIQLQLDAKFIMLISASVKVRDRDRAGRVLCRVSVCLYVSVYGRTQQSSSTTAPHRHTSKANDLPEPLSRHFCHF